jgi:hypothetical protein
MGSDENLPAAQEQIRDKIRGAIDVGLPGIGWELAEEEEWRIIYGYDDRGNYLFRDFDGSELTLHYTELGKHGIGCSEAGYAEPGELLDDRTLARRSAVYALDCAAGKFVEGGRGGMDAYNAWITALDSADLSDGWGCAFNTAVWNDCRSKAPGYFAEAKTRLADPALEPLLDEAAGPYAHVAKSMAALAELFPCDQKDKDGMAARVRDKERRQQGVAAVAAARDAEAKGLAALAKLAAALGAEGVDEKLAAALAAGEEEKHND